MDYKNKYLNIKYNKNGGAELATQQNILNGIRCINW